MSLGASPVSISPLGVGAWSWGDRMLWGYGRAYQEADVQGAFEAAVAAGIDFFDTAEMYGSGQSERLLGQFARQGGKPVVVASKFFPFPWRLSRGALLPALRRSLERLGLDRLDLYQIHWPTPPVPIETWMEALAEAVAQGLTRAVGVSNYNVAQTRRAHQALAARGVPLASNQVRFSLLDRGPERSGLLELCRELNVTLIAYSPLAQGLLTGKYTPAAPPPGIRRWQAVRGRLARALPLVERLRTIGQAHGGKTPAQVALNWVICKGAVPIPGAKNTRQAQENAGALGWRLSEAEVAELDASGETG